MDGQGRRSFTTQAGIAAAGSLLNLSPGAMGANEKVVLALIGGRNQGRGDALPAIKQGAGLKAFCDIEIGRLSTTICHLGDISCRLGRDVRFDPKTETFGSDKQANAYLTKQYRGAYALPKV
jgi:hypothetical protein